MSLDEWVGHGIPDEVVDSAIAWIAKLDSQDVTEQQRQEFYDWLDDDPMHRWAFEELSEIWARTSVLKDQEHLVEKSRILHFPAPTNKDQNRSRHLLNPLPYLAIVLIAFGLIVPSIF